MMNLFWKSSGIIVFSWIIKLFIWWGDKRVRTIRYSKIWFRLYFGWIYSGQFKSSLLFGEEIKEYAWLGIVKFDWHCTLVELTVDILKVLTFNWDCTLVKSEQQQINWYFTWIN